MVVFPNAKINLGLNIISKRQDGYHELETCFFPVPWKEALEIVVSEKINFSASGIEIPGEGDNICSKAYQLLASDYGIPAVHIHLHKVIPIGAGLGGGSADAAFTIKLLNQLFDLGLSTQRQMEYAIKLGADCAFFIKNRPMFAKGIGEKLIESNVSLTGKYLVLVYPGIHISTREAYSVIVPGRPIKSIHHILEDMPCEAWKDYLVNDFEEPLFSTYPLLRNIKKQLYDSGAIYAAMSGSGSTLFGIFEEAPKITFPSNYSIWSGKI